MNINSFKINTTDMSNVETVRKFSVNGEIGAQFQIIALKNPTSSSEQTSYYDFVSSAFELGHNDLNNNLIITLTSPTYSNNIVFPDGGGDYVIKLLALNGTTIRGTNNIVISEAISKQATTTVVTFQAGTANSNNYETFPTSTATGSLNQSTNVAFDWAITNSDDHATLYSFGLLQSATTPFAELDLEQAETKISRNIEQAWYFETTETVDATSGGTVSLKTDTVDGAVSSSTTVTLDNSYLTTNILVGDFVYGTGVTNGTTVSAADNKEITLSAAMSISDGVTLTFVTPTPIITVDDTTDLAKGMIITGVSSGSLSGTPFIKTIDVENKTLTISTDQAFADGVTLTFKAYGQKYILDAIGVSLSFEEVKIKPTTLTKVVEARDGVTEATDGSSTSIALPNTLGIAGGNVTTYSGLNVNNTSSNRVTSVTPDADGTGNDGIIVVELAQELRVGAILTFKGCFAVINFSGTVKINNFPAVARTIYFDLDKFLTVGVAS